MYMVLATSLPEFYGLLNLCIADEACFVEYHFVHVYCHLFYVLDNLYTSHNPMIQLL